MGHAEMHRQARHRELGDAIADALKDQAGAERYQRRQRQARGAKAQTVERPRPLQFDGNGFPVEAAHPQLRDARSANAGPELATATARVPPEGTPRRTSSPSAASSPGSQTRPGRP
jgi:hypothetical protein